MRRSPGRDAGSIPGSGREKGMATHSSTLAWRIPWTEELGGLQSMGLPRVERTLWWHKCERNPKRGNICINIADSLCCVTETQHCKATILQFFKKSKNKVIRTVLLYKRYLIKDYYYLKKRGGVKRGLQVTITLWHGVMSLAGKSLGLWASAPRGWVEAPTLG